MMLVPQHVFGHSECQEGQLLLIVEETQRWLLRLGLHLDLCSDHHEYLPSFQIDCASLA